MTRSLALVGSRGGRGLSVALQIDALRGRGLRSMRAQRTVLRSGVSAAVRHSWPAIYREVWEHAASELGASIEPLDGEYLLISKNGVSTVVWQFRTALNDPVIESLLSDKARVHRLLDGAGIPTADHVAVDLDDPAPAFAFLRGDAPRYVVKPVGGTAGGSGVVGSVRNHDDLARALLFARRWGSRALVERAVVGREFNILFLDGKMLGAIERHPPKVHGDGASTIEELIAAENRRRAEAPGHNELFVIHIDLNVELTLRNANLWLDSVPARGAPVKLKDVVSENASRENTTARDLSAALIADAARAVASTHARFAGVDLVTPDVTRGLSDAGGVIIEVNATPGIRNHYTVADLEHAIPVAVPILDRLLQDAGRAG